MIREFTKPLEISVDSLISKEEAEDLERQTTFTLADAIREGSLSTTQEYGWGGNSKACALSAAYIAARNRGYIV